MFAKLFHVRVEKFYLFFNPQISLVRFKRFEGKWHVKFFAKNEDEEWSKYPDNNGCLLADTALSAARWMRRIRPKTWHPNRSRGSFVPSPHGNVCLSSSAVY